MAELKYFSYIHATRPKFSRNVDAPSASTTVQLGECPLFLLSMMIQPLPYKNPPNLRVDNPTSFSLG